MLKTWHTIKGYVATVVAFVTCPCHLPLTLPLLIGLTAGTAFSAWLAAPRNIFLVGAILIVIFIGGLALALKWTGEAKPPLPDIYAGVPKVAVLTSSACSDTCRDVIAVWHAVREEHKFKFEEVDIISRRGRDLAARHNIFTTPTTLVNGRVAFRGVPKSAHAAAAVSNS